MNSKNSPNSSKGELAEQLFRNGYNCSQAVAAAFCSEMNMTEKDAAKLSIGFGGGTGRLREVCGTVSAMAFVISAIYGEEGRESVYTKIQAAANEFRKRNGSVVCRELLGLNKNIPSGPVPDARTEEYYKKRPCPALVHMAADILDDFLKKQNIQHISGGS